MATFYWIGGAAATAQTATVQITAYDANTTYTLTCGDTSASAAGNVDANTTASDLSTAWNALTQAHATPVTANVTTDTITLTADTAGVPFTITSSVAGGSGTIGNVTETTANAGPASAQTVANYIDGSTGIVATSLPGGSDELVFADGSVNCAYDLAALTGGPDIIVDASYTGRIGLPETSFTTSADGATATSGVREYRTTYLRGPFPDIEIGRWGGIGSATGSGRVKIDNTTSGASVLRVLRTASTSADTGRAAVRYLAAHASADVFIESAAAGVAIAADEPTETSTVGDVYVSDQTTATKLVIGEGTTFTSLTVDGGSNRVIGAAANVTSVNAYGGTLTLTGDWTCTTLTVDGATVNDSHIKTGGSANTTVNLRSGTLDWQVSAEARTTGTLTHTGGTLQDSDVVTVTTRNNPPRSTVTVS